MSKSEYKISNKILSKTMEVIEEILSYNNDDFHVFVDFSGHVCSFSVRWYCGGWAENAERDGETSLYLSGCDKISIERLEKIAERVRIERKLNPTKQEKIKAEREIAERNELIRLQKKYGA